MKRPHPLMLLLATFALLALLHTWATPVFEAPDEVWHYAYARWLAEGHGLPPMDSDISGAHQQVAQPPLYYAAASLISAPFPDDDLDDLMWGNPHFGYQGPLTSADNKNMLIHPPDQRWPWRGAARTIHITRLTSLLFGMLTVAAAWGLGHETLGTRRSALLTAALVAFHPQFVFISSVVSNDSAVAALATATLWMTARVLRRGLTLRRALLVGALTGLSLLCKTSALLLLPLVGAACLWRGWRARPSLRDLIAPLSAYGASALLVGGWWYARNAIRYGAPLGLTAHTQTLWARPEPVPLWALIPELPLLLRSFWAAYGWGHVMWPVGVYLLLGGLSLCALGRSLWESVASARREGITPRHAILALGALWGLGFVTALLQWMRQVGAPHGRLLFPALGAWAVWLANGLRAPDRGANDPLGALSSLLLAALMVASALAPGARILATFAPPRLGSPARMQARVEPRDLAYDERARLLGVEVTPTRVTPGDAFTVEACWEATRPLTEDYMVYVHLLGPDQSRVAERYTYPGLGRFPTSLWPVGRAFCDEYRVTVEPWAAPLTRYQLSVGLFDAETGATLTARGADGSSAMPPVVGAVVVEPRAPVEFAAQIAGYTPLPEEDQVGYRLGDQREVVVALRGYAARNRVAAGETLTVTLAWEARSQPEADLVAFVHVWTPGDDQPLAQHDSRPRQGWFPTTAWQASERVIDAHPIAIPADAPPGRYPLWAGLYHAADGARPPALAGEEDLPYNLIPLGEIEIVQE
ncbi:MAG: glycosyltransferase family 39 protein [Anaerolineales bacterium]